MPVLKDTNLWMELVKTLMSAKIAPARLLRDAPTLRVSELDPVPTSFFVEYSANYGYNAAY